MSNMSEKVTFTTSATSNSKEFIANEPCESCGSFTRVVKTNECASCKKASAIAEIANSAKRLAQHDIDLQRELRAIERSHSLPAGL